MNSTEINRRALLATFAGLGLAGCAQFGRGLPHESDPDTELYVSAYSTQQRSHHFGFYSPVHKTLTSLNVPERGHGICAQSRGDELALISRRPGRFCTIASKRRKHAVGRIEAQPTRHFYGHGCYSVGDTHLFLTENAFETGDGRIGIYDAAHAYRRLGEFPSHGIGPHEISLHPDGRTLVVANGGIQTHPGAPRQKMNLLSMRPSVAFIDGQTGELKQIWTIEAETDQQLSMRHLAINKKGQVAIVCQWEGAPDRSPPLIGLCGLNTPLRFIQAPEDVHRQMRNYCGSVCFNATGDMFAVSAPRGHMITFWTAEGTYLGLLSMRDGCGVSSAQNDAFLMTSGMGSVLTGKPAQPATLLSQHALHWDNHITRI